MIQVLLILLTSAAYANEEITVELPSGATMEMVWITPGTFLMGAPESEFGSGQEEYPQHQVTISHGFYLGKYEITQGQWERVMSTSPWEGQRYGQADPGQPAVYISWDDLQAFVARLNEAMAGELYGLPTEAEWEYACRAGTTTRWSFGDDETDAEDHAWYYDGSPVGPDYHAQPVGSKLPNHWGLHDMHGNVAEWVRDRYGLYVDEPQTDPKGPATGSEAVIRGGSMTTYLLKMRCATRGSTEPSATHARLGARLALRGDLSTALTPQTWGQIKREQ